MDYCNGTSNESIVSRCIEFPNLVAFDALYKSFYGFISTGICTMGMAMNLINIVVLNFPTMRSPTNLLLTGIAIADAITMASYLVYTLYLNVFALPYPCNYAHSWGWIAFLLVHNAVSITSHTMASLLIVALALFRCRVLQRREVSQRNSNDMRYARTTLIGATLLSIVFCFPNNIIYYIEEIKPNHFWFFTYSWAQEFLVTVNFIIYGCFVKILTSVIIIILSTFLLLALSRARQSQIRLGLKPSIRFSSSNSTPKKWVATTSIRMVTGGGSVEGANGALATATTMTTNKRTESHTFLSPNVESAANVEEEETMLPAKEIVVSSLSSKRKQNFNYFKTTIMLVTVVVSFAATEIPQGVLNTLAALDDCFRSAVYIHIGDLMDTLVFINSSLNFVLYCAMSRQFRQTFKTLFLNRNGSRSTTAGSVNQYGSHAIISLMQRR